MRLSCKRANLAIKREILDELFRDPEWNRRMEQAKTSREVAQVVADFGRARHYKVIELPVGVVVLK